MPFDDNEEFGFLGYLRDFASRGAYESATPHDFEHDEIEDGKPMAVLSYVPFLCFFAYLHGRNNRFTREHAKQGIVLFIAEVIAVIGALFWKAALFLASVAAVAGIVYALQGKLWKIPLIGVIADKLEGTAHKNRK